MIADIDLDHVALAAESQAELWPRYRGDLGGEWLAGGYTIGFASAQVRFANGMKVEALEPFEPERSDFLRRFLDRSGPGPHHLTFKVHDIEAAIAASESAGYPPVGVDLRDPEWKEAFLHPKDATGVVVQLAQSIGGDWQSPPPEGFPEPRRAPAALDHVAHLVRGLDDGLALFGGLLGGSEIGRGAEEGLGWVDLAWPGPGRVRLLHATAGSGPLAAWLGDRPGRVHHLAFTVDDPAGLPGARALADGRYEVAPEDNLGARLVLRAP